MSDNQLIEIEIFVEGEGLAGIELFKIPLGSSAREIVLAVAERSGFPVEEGILFLEDREEPLDLAAIVAEDASGKVHHVHRAKHIDVTVFYQNIHPTHQFSPSMRVQWVLDWAVGPDGLKIDAALAPEMELALHGSTTALPKDGHLGRYIRHPEHRLDLDLIRGVVPNGALL